MCAGVSGGRIVLWHYLQGNWNGGKAADLYNGPIYDALVKHRGLKRGYRILEDNDPTGYKSSKALAAKAAKGITTIDFPRYSPELNPLDFSLWDEILRRMNKSEPNGVENLSQYKKRLRLTALRLPERVVRAAVAAIRERAAMVVRAGGKNIKRD